MNGSHAAKLQSFSSSKDTVEEALGEISRQFDPSNSAFMLVFAHPRYASDELEENFERYWADLPVYGCTTAGEICSSGYAMGSIVAINFPKEHFAAQEILYDFKRERTLVEIAEKTRAEQAKFNPRSFQNKFGILLIDGVSGMEDVVAAATEIGLDNRIPIFGGSAADNMEFNRTTIFSHRKGHQNAALLVMIATDYDFRGFGFDHFEPTDVKAIVTGAIPDQRIISELNGSPAAKEYARLIDKPLESITANDFAANPLLVRSGENYHVRSIKEFNSSGQIEMLAAIDYGLVFNLGRGKELIKTLVSELASVTLRNQKPELIIGFDCVLRKLEITEKKLADDVSDVLSQFNVIGFNTYGEQYVGVHVNQTFVGIALFVPPTNIHE